MKKKAMRDIPLTKDCELAAAVNKVVWKEMHRGIVGLAKKLNDAGFVTTFTLGLKPSEYLWLAEAMAGTQWRRAVAHLYRMPFRIKRNDPTYKERIELLRLAEKSRLIFFGTLTETDNDGLPKVLKDEFRQYLTSYVVLRVQKTNTCLVHLTVCEHRPKAILLRPDTRHCASAAGG